MRKKDLSDSLLRLLASPNYQPLDKIGLSKELAISPDDRNELRHLLRKMEDDGKIVCLKKNRYALPKTDDLIRGRLEMNARGFGFLIGEIAGSEHLFIAAENTGTAMHGDTVEAKIRRERSANRRETRGPMFTVEGQVIRVVRRANETLVGSFINSNNGMVVRPDDPRILQSISIRNKISEGLIVRNGDKVVVTLDEWKKRYDLPTGRITEVLGAADAPGVDMLSIIRKYHLSTEFPRPVQDAAKRFEASVQPADIEGREDLRKLTIFTIDPDDAKDFDDAICVDRTDSGWLLGVHIADVSHYVTPLSELDREAWERGNSTYLPDRVIPMLPERLSNGLCSLRPNEDRLTFTVWMRFDDKGKILSTTFSRSVICSAKRLTYQEAFAVLEGRARSPVENELHLAWKLASLLRKNRFTAGSLDLDFPEIKVRVDHLGKAIALEKVQNDISHQMIEEFMLSANESVAREIKNRTVPSIYRIHEKPDPERLAEYRDNLAVAGLKVGDLSVKGEVQRLLKEISGRPDEPVLKIGLLRSLKRATYDVRSLGHYGLAKVNYTHFTSPIRRYADLVVHRVLGAMITQQVGKISPSARDLKITAEHISTTERISADAERDATKLKKLEYFSQQLEIKNPDRFTGVISDIKSHGLVVELLDFSLTGLVHTSRLTDDYYQFDPVRRQFSGKRTRKIYKIGQALQLIVCRVDKFKNQIDFSLADSSLTT